MATTETILEATIKVGVEHFGGIPSGTMIAFAGKSVPDGWLLCNGALVSRTTYAKLFAAIGTAWGAGNGSTTFKLPDADGRVMQGVTDANKVGQYLKAGLPNITGNVSTAGEFGADVFEISSINGAFVSDAAVMGWSTITGQKGIRTKTAWLKLNASKSNEIYSKSNTVQSAALQTLIIIKV